MKIKHQILSLIFYVFFNPIIPDLQASTVPLLSSQGNNDSSSALEVAAVANQQPYKPEATEGAYSRLAITRLWSMIPLEVELTEKELLECNTFEEFDRERITGAIKSTDSRNRVYAKVDEAAASHIENYIVDFFPAQSGIHKDLAFILREYLPLGAEQQDNLLLNIGYTVRESQNIIEQSRRERKECQENCRNCCCNCLGISCICIGIPAIIVGALWARYSCGISPIANIQETCWQQPYLQCCGEQTMYGDPIPGVLDVDALNSRITEIAFKADCSWESKSIYGGGICAQTIDCATVNITSPSYYKNFDPCNLKSAKNRKHAVKPSFLARKIAMARDKQLKRKQHKK
jgi:hypothetical protein